jgi:hypothetical protein
MQLTPLVRKQLLAIIVSLSTIAWMFSAVLVPAIVIVLTNQPVLIVFPSLCDS